MLPDEGWHTYWKNPGDTGLPTRIQWEAPHFLPYIFVITSYSIHYTKLYDVAGNKAIKIQTETIPGLKDLPDYLKDYPEKMPKDPSAIKNRPINLMGPVWNPEKDIAVVVALSQDNKDRWILLLDPATGNLDLLDRQRDEAWIVV